MSRHEVRFRNPSSMPTRMKHPQHNHAAVLTKRPSATAEGACHAAASSSQGYAQSTALAEGAKAKFAKKGGCAPPSPSLATQQGAASFRVLPGGVPPWRKPDQRDDAPRPPPQRDAAPARSRAYPPERSMRRTDAACQPPMRGSVVGVASCTERDPSRSRTPDRRGRNQRRQRGRRPRASYFSCCTPH